MAFPISDDSSRGANSAPTASLVPIQLALRAPKAYSNEWMLLPRLVIAEVPCYHWRRQACLVQILWANVKSSLVAECGLMTACGR
jgi:hypothetical protein